MMRSGKGESDVGVFLSTGLAQSPQHVEVHVNPDVGGLLKALCDVVPGEIGQAELLAALPLPVFAVAPEDTKAFRSFPGEGASQAVEEALHGLIAREDTG